MQYIWPIFKLKINVPGCERTATEIDERENFKDIFIDPLSFYTQKNSQERNRFLAEICGMFTSFLHLEITRNTSRKFLNVIILVYCNTISTQT